MISVSTVVGVVKYKACLAHCSTYYSLITDYIGRSNSYRKLYFIAIKIELIKDPVLILVFLLVVLVVVVVTSRTEFNYYQKSE